MKITFVSNYLSHHQLPFSTAMAEKIGDNYCFVATQPMNEERIRMGWSQGEKAYPFELRTYENENAARQAKELALESDVVIIGSAPDKYIVQRLAARKLTFKYSERPFKKGVHPGNLFHLLCGTWLHHGRFQSKPLYMLCASGYAASDFERFGCYRGKCFEWGYFPETIKYSGITELIAAKQPNSILWAARLIDLKHPEVAVQIAKRLAVEGYTFQMDIIGNGDMEKAVQNMIKKENLSNCVHLLGAMTPQQVRAHMDQSEIFLFTSDFNEGWGAVLNEAMNSACAVVASHAIGSVPFLINNKQNGLVYENGNLDDLYQNTKWLLENSKQRKQLAMNAYQTITEQWNAESAADHLLTLCEQLMQGKATPYSGGPCCPAPVIPQKKMYQYLTERSRSNMT